MKLAPPHGSVARLVMYGAFACVVLALLAWVAVRGVNWALRRRAAERTHALAESEALSCPWSTAARRSCTG